MKILQFLRKIINHISEKTRTKIVLLYVKKTVKISFLEYTAYKYSKLGIILYTLNLTSRKYYYIHCVSCELFFSLYIQNMSGSSFAPQVFLEKKRAKE